MPTKKLRQKDRTTLERLGKKVANIILKERGYKSLDAFSLEFHDEIAKPTLYQLCEGKRDMKLSTLIGLSRALEISLCKPEVGNKLDVPDKCARGGYFAQTNLEGSLLFNKFLAQREQLVPETKKTVTYDSVKKDLTSIGDMIRDWYDDSIDKGGLEIPQFPYAGQVTLSPYKKSKTANLTWYDSDAVLHELSHACSSIRRQETLASTKDPSLLYSEAFSLVPADHQIYCSAYGQREAYLELYSQFLDGNPSLTECLGGLGTVARDGAPNRPPCQNACPASFYEESFAEIQAWKSKKFDRIEDDACFGSRDSVRNALNMERSLRKPTDRVHRFETGAPRNNSINI